MRQKKSFSCLAAGHGVHGLSCTQKAVERAVLSL